VEFDFKDQQWETYFQLKWTKWITTTK
jgi:hypothetical protein